MTDREQRLARDLLRTRRKGFPSPWGAIVGRKKGHLLRYLAIGVFAWLLAANWAEVAFRGYLLLGLGFVLGAILKEFAVVRAIGNNWPFTEKVLDWDRIAQLADEGDDPATDDER